MTKQIRVSQHSGRMGYARHNDRDFDISKAEHIDSSRTDNNLYWDVFQGARRGSGSGFASFTEVEEYYYREYYHEALDAQNARHIKGGHADRCRTPEDLYKSATTQPEELILQIGDKDTDINPADFEACCQEYLSTLDNWNRAHGEHMCILDWGIHHDESSPHMHLRRVWECDTGDGLRPAQDKALEAAGVQLPDPSKKRGRHNNRKMTFDAWAREQWIQICERHGYDVNREPIPDARHKDKEDYVRGKVVQTLQEAVEAAERYSLDSRDQTDAEARKTLQDAREKASRKYRTAKTRELDAREASLDAREDALKAREDALSVREEDLSARELKASRKASYAEQQARQILEQANQKSRDIIGKAYDESVRIAADAEESLGVVELYALGDVKRPSKSLTKAAKQFLACCMYDGFNKNGHMSLQVLQPGYLRSQLCETLDTLFRQIPQDRMPEPGQQVLQQERQEQLEAEQQAALQIHHQDHGMHR